MEKEIYAVTNYDNRIHDVINKDDLNYYVKRTLVSLLGKEIFKYLEYTEENLFYVDCTQAKTLLVIMDSNRYYELLNIESAYKQLKESIFEPDKNERMN